MEFDEQLATLRQNLEQQIAALREKLKADKMDLFNRHLVMVRQDADAHLAAAKRRYDEQMSRIATMRANSVREELLGPYEQSVRQDLQRWVAAYETTVQNFVSACQPLLRERTL